MAGGIAGPGSEGMALGAVVDGVRVGGAGGTAWDLAAWRASDEWLDAGSGGDGGGMVRVAGLGIAGA